MGSDSGSSSPSWWSRSSALLSPMSSTRRTTAKARSSTTRKSDALLYRRSIRASSSPSSLSLINGDELHHRLNNRCADELHHRLNNRCALHRIIIIVATHHYHEPSGRVLSISTYEKKEELTSGHVRTAIESMFSGQQSPQLAVN